jgi:HK97 family phage major capsid protein
LRGKKRVFRTRHALVDMNTRNFNWRTFLNTREPIEGFENRVMQGNSGRFVPFDLLTRDLNVGTFSAGGALTGQKVESGIIPFLRAKSVCGRLGATVITGLVPNTGTPVMVGDYQAAWMAESQQATSADVTLAQVLTTPHRITISLNASKLLALQSSADFESFVASEASAKLFQALDQAALNGTGGTQPIGILNAAGTSQVTFGGAASWPKILSMEQDIGNANADGPAMGWAQSPDTRAKWKAIQRASGTSTFLQADDNTVAGYTAAMTTELNSTNAGDKCVFGNWSDLAIGIFFDGVWVSVNPYSLDTTGETRYVFHLYCDVSLRHPASFCISTDSAAQ